jgi:uncharacterized membrane protein
MTGFAMFNCCGVVCAIVFEIIGCVAARLMFGAWYVNFFTVGFGAACIESIIAVILAIAVVVAIIAWLLQCFGNMIKKETTVKTHVYELDAANNA